MNFVMVYGPPGVGKLTVATELSRLTGYKLFSNSVSIDWAKTVFEFDTPGFWRLVGLFREAVVGVAARENLDLISTIVYAHDEDLPWLAERFRTVEEPGGRVCLVQLTCDQDVLEARVRGETRMARGKLASVETLREWQQRYDMTTPLPGRESLRIDNTHLSPEEVAHRVVEQFGLQVVAVEQ